MNYVCCILMLNPKGLCAVVCISVARMFVVVEGFNMTKSVGATDERIKAKTKRERKQRLKLPPERRVFLYVIL